jgi:hypothetical protein
MSRGALAKNEKRARRAPPGDSGSSLVTVLLLRESLSARRLELGKKAAADCGVRRGVREASAARRVFNRDTSANGVIRSSSKSSLLSLSSSESGSCTSCISICTGMSRGTSAAAVDLRPRMAAAWASITRGVVNSHDRGRKSTPSAVLWLTLVRVKSS